MCRWTLSNSSRFEIENVGIGPLGLYLRVYTTTLKCVLEAKGVLEDSTSEDKVVNF